MSSHMTQSKFHTKKETAMKNKTLIFLSILLVFAVFAAWTTDSFA